MVRVGLSDAESVRLGSGLLALVFFHARLLDKDRRGKRVAFVEASVTDDTGRLLARATSTYIYRERN